MKRSNLKLYLYICFVLIVVVMSWEQSRNHPALAASIIPEESIRLRILAHTDAAQDQWIKRKVRDAITGQVSSWVHEPDTIDSARDIINDRIDRIETRIGEVLDMHGYTYGYKVELGKVDFPTKMYGNKVYPAGTYEALRVTLGDGRGQNWWCVLFPPLCFVDLATGEAVASDQSAADEEKEQAFDQKEQVQVLEAQEQPEAEVRFLLWDVLRSLADWLEGLLV